MRIHEAIANKFERKTREQMRARRNLFDPKKLQSIRPVQIRVLFLRFSCFDYRAFNGIRGTHLCRYLRRKISQGKYVTRIGIKEICYLDVASGRDEILKRKRAEKRRNHCSRQEATWKTVGRLYIFVIQ